jgi:ribose transport system substrate-binding protein
MGISKRGIAALLVSLALATALTAAGCGSDSDTSTESTSSSSGSASSAVAAAEAAVAEGKKGIGAGIPSSSPPPAKDKTVVLIPCIASAEGCSEPMKGAAEAAKVLGWTTRTIDGKGTPPDQAAAIEQAIALDPDAIIMHGVDPNQVKGAVNNATAAGIPIISSSSPETDLVAFSSSPSREQWLRTGELIANYIIAETDGKAKYIQLTNKEVPVVIERDEGFERAIKKCEECERVALSTFTVADVATKVPQLTQQLLQTHPEADVIYAPADSLVSLVMQGQQAVGKELMFVSGDGAGEALQCIRDDCGLTATVAVPVNMIGWIDIDAANRVFNGEDPNVAASGLSMKLMDSSNVQSEPGTWSGGIDLEAAYSKLWNSGS